MSSETTSLSYDEIAAIFGIERESARQLTLRKRWHRVKGNDGKARVEVPNDAIPSDPSEDTSHVTGETPSDSTVDDDGLTRALTRHIERLEQSLATSQETVTRMEAERDKARAETRDIERARDVALESVRTTMLEVAALKGALDAEKARSAIERERSTELKAERDRWAEQASRSWWRRLVG